MYKAEGWMCNVDFEFEVGAASDGNTVYPSENNLRKNRICVNADDECRPKRVYVVDADAFDKEFKEI